MIREENHNYSGSLKLNECELLTKKLTKQNSVFWD
jgi:hypothetical protein